MLTTQDLETLKRKFAPDEHEFREKYVYITEGAVSDRIEEVDPAWQFEILHTNIRDNQAVIHARLTIKGVSRDGVGMQAILERGGAEPEKGAATDALKRCARLFGIGRYLLDTPSGVTNMDTLTKWLNGTLSQNNGTQSGAATNKGSGGHKPQNGAQNADAWDKPAIEAFVAYYADKMVMAELLATLNVQRFGEWKQGGVAAYKAVEQQLKARAEAF